MTDSNLPLSDLLRAESWPQPIADSLDRLEGSTLAIERHQELLYLFGSLLRTVSGILGSVYLRSDASVAALDRCILTDLRRPTFGNQVKFLTACAGAKRIQWGIAADVVASIRKLLKTPRPALLTASSRRLLDALLDYRNKTIHAGCGLREDEAKTRLPGLESGLQALLEAMSVLRHYKFSSTRDPVLVRGVDECPLVPGFDRDAENFLGVLEGWDSKDRTLHYVAAVRAWESVDRWDVWTALLRKRGLLPAHWNEIEEPWLRSRSRALLPERLAFPEGVTPPQDLVEAAWLCIESDGYLRAEDPSAVVALLCAGQGDRIFFTATPDDPSWAKTPEEALTDFFGCQPALGALPSGHPLEALIARVVLVLPAYGVSGAPNWQRLEADFAGLRVIRVERPAEGKGGFVVPPSLLAQVRAALFAFEPEEGGCGVVGSDSAQQRTWDATFLEARLLAIPGNSRDFEERLDSCIDEFVPVRADPDATESLFALARSPDTAPERWRQLFRDLGLLETTVSGTIGFVDAVVRARVFARAVGMATDRQAARLLSEPPGEADEPIADVLVTVERDRGVRPSQGSGGEGLLLARKTVLGIKVGRPGPGYGPALSVLWIACRILVRWRRPDLVTDLISQHGYGIAAEATRDLAAALEFGQGLRTHGDPESAIRFFKEVLQPLRGREANPLLQALAGTLRDRGQRGDRESAKELYATLLAQDDLEPELRLHAACGAAENLSLMGRPEEAIELLERLRTDNREVAPRLRAVVEHRLAATLIHAGRREEALTRAAAAVELLEDRLQGSFAARALDTYARCLQTAGLEGDARRTAEQSLSIKRALGDRRGIQISLGLLSTMLQISDPVAARSAATEAWDLAVASGDSVGERVLRRRLETLDRLEREHRSQSTEHSEAQ